MREKTENDLSLYDAVKDQIRSGDHIGFRGKSLLAYAIRCFGGTINHSGLAVKVDLDGLEKRRYTLEALSRGIEFHRLSEQLKHYDGQAWWYPLKDEYEPLRPKIAAWAFDKVDTPYDYGGLIKNALGRVSADMRALFCSEFCFMAWRSAGIPIEFREGKAPRPGDIEEFDIFKAKVRIL